MATVWTEAEGGTWTGELEGVRFQITTQRFKGADRFKLDVQGRYGMSAIGSTVGFASLAAAQEEASVYRGHLAQSAELGRKAAHGAEGTHSPWGTVQHAETYGEGVLVVSTSGHGGFKLDAARNRAMPEALRLPGGWYEEDVAWTRLALGHPALFTDMERRDAHLLLRNFDPDTYEAATGTVLEPGQSRAKDERAFKAVHADDLLSVSALNSREHPGMVEVQATPGGDRSLEARKFLVPAADYAARSFSFVVDPALHEEVGAPAAPGMR